MDTHFYNYRNKRCLLLGSIGNIGSYLIDFCKKNGMRLTTLDPAEEENLSRGIFKSGEEVSVNNAFDKAIEKLGGLDFILCSYDFEKLRKSIKTEETDKAMWDELLRDWGLNQFLVLKAAASRFNDGNKRRIVYFHSTRGYTGEGEGEGQLSPGGSLYEAACSGGITGMMTSIARSIIPLAWSVNGIAYDELNEISAAKVAWGLHLWLSGIGEYSCGETYRIYEK